MKLFLAALTTALMVLLLQSPAQAALQDIELQTADVRGVRIAWAEIGDPKGAPLLMIMGLGSSHKVWGEPLLDGLAEAGYRLILFDNRDVGASQRFNDQGQPVIWWNLLKNSLGFSVSARYTLADMAADSVGLLDMLNIKDAHIVGASMGGMIAQLIAVQYPQRTRSLISIMSSTGAAHLPAPGEDDSDNIKDIAASDEQSTQQLNQRGFYPKAIPRHFMAVLDSGDRSEQLKTISAKTLVIHGVDDPLLPLPHGEHTAAMIPNAEFISFAGMGHNIPVAVLPKLLKQMKRHINAVEKGLELETMAKK